MVSIFFCCSDKSKPQLAETSYWENLIDSFATKNLDSFVIDSQLQATYKNFHRVKNRVIDSVVGFRTSYLYSLQESDRGLRAFTIFVDDGEHGSRIIYFIVDGKDSLRSVTQVANKSGEGGILFETRSRFMGKDTLYKTSAATMQWDLSETEPWLHRLNKSKGDSTFFHLIVLNDGQVIEKQVAEKKELNLE